MIGFKELSKVRPNVGSIGGGRAIQLTFPDELCEIGLADGADECWERAIGLESESDQHHRGGVQRHEVVELGELSE